MKVVCTLILTVIAVSNGMKDYDRGNKDERMINRKYHRRGYNDERTINGRYFPREYNDERMINGKYHRRGYNDERMINERYPRRGYNDERMINGRYLRRGYNDERMINGRYLRRGYDDEDTVECGSSANGKTGILTSPNYPANYGNDVNCQTVITVPADHHIDISIVDMDIETCNNCGCDYLEIIDDGASSGKKYCGTTKFNLRKRTKALRIKFKSDGSYNRPGFRLTWKISSDYYNGFKCVFKPGIGSDYTHIGELEETECINACIEKKKEDASINGVIRYTDISRKNCWCWKDTPNRNNAKNAHSCVFEKTTKCSYSYNPNGMSGVLTSPNYPNAYGNNNNCMRIISVPTGHLIEISIDKMDIEPHPQCNFDYLKITDGSSVMGKYCGKKENLNLTSKTNKIIVEFKTDVGSVYSGFRLTWKMLAPKTAAPVVLYNGFKCNFELGIGDHSHSYPLDAYKYDEKECILACVELKKKVDADINGIAKPANAAIKSCSCVVNLKGRKDNKYVKTCFLEENGTN